MSKSLATKNVAAILVAAALVFGFAFTFAAPAKADTLSDLQAQVQALLAQIASLQGSSSTTTGGSCTTFTQTLTVGSTGGEVMAVQQFLNTHGAVVASTGAGSPGNESSYFGAKTQAAVAKFQAANGVSPAAGYWGPLTRAKANSMCTGGTTTTGGGTVTPTGPGITVSAAAQPANSLAPAGASRVPFTSFTLTNNTGSSVTINGISVQRTGLAQDAAFASIVLVDNSGFQIGVSRTFDSNHQATVGDTFTLNPGASVTYTVAGNMNTTETAYAGQVASISVIGVNTSVPVSGSLPISGAQQTINNTLTTGSVTVNISSFDPNSALTKNIGDTGIRFTGVRLTAGSQEDLKLYSVRFRLNGTISPGDVGNLVAVINGTSYPTMWSTDGRYVTVSIPGGVLIAKGNSTDVYLQGDLTGSGAAGRVVEFDVDKTSDIYLVGQTYGYGILPVAPTSIALLTGTTHATKITSSQPYFQGSTVTINAGTATNIQNSPSVAAQNIAINTSNQVLGGFDVNFAGEPVTVQGMTFTAATSGGVQTDMTSISIVDSNGSVVAGPVDQSSNGNIVFTNSVTFPVGQHTYTLKGTIPSTGWSDGNTVQLATNPSSTWTSPQGQTSGNSITISTGNFTLNTMTVRGAQLSLSLSATPSSQTIVAGAQNLVFANVQLDASQSGEDIRVSSVPVAVTSAYTTDTAYLSNCGLWNGSTLLTSGSNVVNTLKTGDGSTVNTFTFDNPLTVAKGTLTSLALQCNLSSSATSTETFAWKLPAASTITSVTGVQSGNSVTNTSGLTVNQTAGGTMAVAQQASVAVTLDASSPSYTLAAGGTSGVTVGVAKFRPSNEGVSLQKVGLTLGNGNYSGPSGAQDVFKAYLYNGSTLLGTAIFAGNATTATSTLTTALNLPVNVDTLITIKADLSDIGTGQPGTEGDIVRIDALNFQGSGLSSGGTVNGGGTAASAGVALFNTFPTVALDTLPSNGVADGRLIHFKVTADSHGNVGIFRLAFNVSTSSLTAGSYASNFALYGFTDPSYSSPISGQNSGGQIDTTLASTAATSCGTGNNGVNGSTCTLSGGTATLIFNTTATSPVEVPAGQTYYFELRSTITGVQTGSSIVTTLLSTSTPLTTVKTAANAAGSFIWSPNATTTTVSTVTDWTNGYGVSGLPSSGLIQARSN